MASRECEACTRRFGTGVGHVKCIFCGGELSYNAGQSPTVEKEEYEVQMWVKGLKGAKELAADELIEIEREWDALDMEVARRKGYFTVPDLIQEGFRPRELAP